MRICASLENAAFKSSKKFDKLIFVAAHNTTEAVTAKKLKSVLHLNHIVLLDLRGGFLSA